MSHASNNSLDTFSESEFGKSSESSQNHHRDLTDSQRCPNCNNIFHFMKKSNPIHHVTSRIPLILPCHHVICENCIFHNRLNNHNQCPICKYQLNITKKDLDRLAEIFVPHFTIMGRLVYERGGLKKYSFDMVNTGKTLKDIQADQTEETNSIPEVQDIPKYNEEFSKLKASVAFTECPEHTGFFKNLKCADCDLLVCCQCFVEDHPRHMPIHLYKQSSEDEAKFRSFVAKLRHILRNLHDSQKKLASVSTIDQQTIDNAMKKYFDNLHAQLLLIEKKFPNKINGHIIENSSLNKVQKSISSITQVLSLCNIIETKQINTSLLMEKVEQLLDVPCKLSKDIISNGEPFKFVGPDEYLTENNFSLEIDGANVSLEICDDFDDSYTEKDDTVIKEVTPKRNPSPPIKRPTPPKEITIPPQPKPKSNIDKQELIKVIVTHLNNMNSFYIQRIASMKPLSNLTHQLSRKPKRDVIEKNIAIGNIYAILFATKQNSYWRRGKLIDINNQDAKNKYEVLYIDYGNTQIVSSDQLKLMDKDYIRKQPFAQHCCLKHPKDLSWGENIHLHFAQIVNGKEIFMKILRVFSPLLIEVELFMYGSNSALININDLLANYSNDTNSNHDQHEDDVKSTASLRFYKNSKKFEKEQSEEVIVTHLVDPFNIYIQLAKYSNSIKQMHEEIQKYCESNSNNFCIPVENTDVIVKYNDFRKILWHRANILSVDSITKKAKVFLVDHGLTVDVSWEDIRQLTRDFIKFEQQSIKIQLAHVVPINLYTNWPGEVAEFLKDLLYKEAKLKMIVNNINPLEVALFKYGNEAEICVNALLVENNLAVSTGSISETTCWIQTKLQKKELLTDHISTQILKSTEERLLNDPDLIMPPDTFRPQIEVVHCDNPHLIYFKFTDFKEKEANLTKELQIYYKSSKERKNHWKKSELCVIWDKVTQSYLRGVIREKKEEGGNLYKVFLYDCLREVDVIQKDIYIYDYYFKKNYLDCVYKCHLYNLKPAGSNDKWSQIAIEMLIDIFDTYKLILIRKMEEDIEHKSFGVDMWYAVTVEGHALEPTQIRYISINKALVEAGFAFYIVKPEIGQESFNLNHSDIPQTIKEERFEEESVDSYELSNDFPKVIRLSSKRFIGNLICMESTGMLSIRDKATQELYNELEKKLNHYMRDIGKNISTNSFQVNQYCAILYDDVWYRARIMEALPTGKYSIEMIDFSSEHECSSKELRELSLFNDVPPLLVKIGFYNIKCDEWDLDDYQRVMDVLESEMEFIIKTDLDSPIILAEINYLNGKNLNELVLQICQNLQRLEIKADDELFCDIQEVDNNKEVTNRSDEFKGEDFSLFDVLDHEKVVLKYNKTQSPSTKIDGTTQPELTKIEVNNTCLCLDNDKTWNRGIIYNVDSKNYGFILIFLVDKGRLAMFPQNKLRENDEHFFDLPYSYYIASLNYEILNNSQRNLDEICNLLKKLVNNKSIQIEIVSQNELKIHLFKDNVLCYQKLIDSGILKCV